MRIALLGDVTLDLLARDLRKAGHEVYLPPGFDTWRQELLSASSGLVTFAPEHIFLISTEPVADLPHNVTPLDLTALAAEVPGFYDERMRVLAAMPFSLAGLAALREEIEFVLAARTGAKVLAVDADNTLWRGIISEDGPEAVEPFVDFQRAILALRAEGVLPILLTKNDPPTADAPIVRAFARDDMPLSLNDFAAVRSNWSPKPGNLIEVCRELNLAEDAVVFIDDNPHERAQMKAHLPQVFVPNFDSLTTLVRRLKTYCFTNRGTTAEDAVRANSYAAEARRRESFARFTNVEEYLASLHMQVNGARACKDDIPRLAQMAQKTNQFNATTLRRTAEEFAALISNPEYRVWCFRLSDDFGDFGLIAYIIYSSATHRITDFVMSCRAMGRRVEFTALNFVRTALASEQLLLDGIDFIPSAKNTPFATFLASLSL